MAGPSPRAGLLLVGFEVPGTFGTRPAARKLQEPGE